MDPTTTTTAEAMTAQEERPVGTFSDRVAEVRQIQEDSAKAMETDPTWGFTRCMACRRPLYLRNLFTADGCPCNAPRGINHGIVPEFVCTCKTCDPEQTGGTRKSFTVNLSALEK